MIEFFLEQEELFRFNLSIQELENYEKNLAIIKLRPFLKLWIQKHFGKLYLDNKYATLKRNKENLDFYYTMLQY